MNEFALTDAVITKKIIDLLVEFLRKGTKRNRLYEQTKVTDRFSLEAVRLPAVVVKNVSNTQRRTDYTDYIAAIYGRVQLVPISGDNTLVGSNIIRTNLPETLDYDPRWSFDPTIGYPSGYGFSGTGTAPHNPSYDITAAVFTSQTGGSFNSDVTTGIVITLPEPNEFEPTSILYGLESTRSDGTASVKQTNPINPTFRTVNPTGLVLETQVNYAYPISGSIQVSVNLDLLPNFNPSNAVIYPDFTGTNIVPIPDNTNVYIFDHPITGINAIYSGNNTSSGQFPFSGIGISGAGWYQTDISGTNYLNWTSGSGLSFSGAIVAGQVPATGVRYGVDYNYEGPDVHTIAVALNDTQDQFYLIYSGISLGGSSVAQPVEPDQYIVSASGLVPGLTGTVIKLNDVLWAGDQYQVLTFQKDILTYSVYGGLYEMSVQFECYANSTIEAQELGDLVEQFLVARKKLPYNKDAFNFTGWSQGGQGEEEYINDHIFSTSVATEGFRFWQQYRGGDLITDVCINVLPQGFYSIAPSGVCGTIVPIPFPQAEYFPPAVQSTVNTTNPIVANQSTLNLEPTGQAFPLWY